MPLFLEIFDRPCDLFGMRLAGVFDVESGDRVLRACRTLGTPDGVDEIAVI